MAAILDMAAILEKITKKKNWKITNKDLHHQLFKKKLYFFCVALYKYHMILVSPFILQGSIPCCTELPVHDLQIFWLSSHVSSNDL